MKKITFTLLLFVFAYQAPAQAPAQAQIQKIGIKPHFRLDFIERTFASGMGLDFEYNRSFYNQQHFLSAGIGGHLTIIKSQIEIDSAKWYPNELKNLADIGIFVSIPIHYIYQPFPWLYVRTGFNNNIPIRSITQDLNSLFLKEGIPDYRKFVLEYHAGLGLEVPIKRISIRLEAFFNYAILTNEYMAEGASLGVFYKFKK